MGCTESVHSRSSKSTTEVKIVSSTSADGHAGKAGATTGQHRGNVSPDGRPCKGLTKPPSLYSLKPSRDNGKPSAVAPAPTRGGDVNMEALRSATTDADGISPLPSPRYTMSQPTESFQSHQVDDGGHGSITLALKHSQSSRLPGRKTPPPANRFNDRLNRTTSLEGRFRTKSARTLQRRPTVETKVAIVSKDLAPDASSSDDDSSGEDTPKRQQRFVNQ